jgi:hypothetical protein
MKLARSVLSIGSQTASKQSLGGRATGSPSSTRTLGTCPTGPEARSERQGPRRSSACRRAQAARFGRLPAPHGIPTSATFTLTPIELAPLPDQQLVVRNLFMSVIDHAMDAFIGLFRGQNIGTMVVELT